MAPPSATGKLTQKQPVVSKAVEATALAAGVVRPRF